MKKIIVTCCVVFSMLISAKGNDYHITDFLPDSLISWQVRARINTDGRTSLLGEDKSVTEDTLHNEYELSQSGNRVSFRPNIDLLYKQITLKREIYWNTSLNLRATKSKDARDNIAIYGTQNIANPFEYESEINSYSLNTLMSSTLSITQYLFKNFGLKLSGRTHLSYAISSRKESGQSDNFIYSTYSYLEQIRHNESLKKSKRNSTETGLTLSPGIVLGRTYDGFYAAKAEEILIELKKINQLKRDLSRDEFKHLSMIILQHTEMFYFDSRIRRIEALKDIINYLKSIKAIENSNVMSILTINDIYLFSPTYHTRRFGTRFYINCELGSNNSDRRYFTDRDYKSWINDYDSLGIFLYDSILSDYYIHDKQEYFTDSYPKRVKIGVSFNKIKSWHFWYNIDLSYNYYLRTSSYKSKFESSKDDWLNDTTIVEKTSSIIKLKIEDNYLRLYVRLNYQINSRSIFTTNLSFYYKNSRTNAPYYYRRGRKYYIDSDSETQYDQYNDKVSLNIAPNFKYYITPKFSISTGLRIELWREEYHMTRKQIVDDAEVSYYKKDIPQRWKFQASFNFGFVYYF